MIFSLNGFRQIGFDIYFFILSLQLKNKYGHPVRRELNTVKKLPC